MALRHLTKDNCEKVAQWLLQCDYSDFNGPLVVVAELYGALEESYQDWEYPLPYTTIPYAKILPVMTAIQRLAVHLNKPAKDALQKNIAARIQQEENAKKGTSPFVKLGNRKRNLTF